MFKILLDAGHGGRDRGFFMGCETEANQALKLCEAVYEKLQPFQDVQVMLTRAVDKSMEPVARYEFAKEWGADLVLSIHKEKNVGRGITSGVYTTHHPHNPSAEELYLAGMLSERVANAMHVDNMGVHRSITTHHEFLNMDCVVLYAGYITNSNDNFLFHAHMDKIASAIVDSIAFEYNLETKHEHFGRPFGEKFKRFDHYIVAPGDDKKSIAKKTKCSFKVIRKLNGLKDGLLIFPGQKLKYAVYSA
jgi:N-acetylmuramoyl-L-alanine amidase